MFVLTKEDGEYSDYTFTILGFYSNLKNAKEKIIQDKIDNPIEHTHFYEPSIYSITEFELDKDYDNSQVYTLCENKLIRYKNTGIRITYTGTLNEFYKMQETKSGDKDVYLIHDHTFKDTIYKDELVEILTSKVVDSQGNKRYVFPFPTTSGGHIQIFNLIAEYADS